jgi:hypothetical protein
MTEEIEQLGRQTASSRDLFLLSLPDPGSFPDDFELPSPHFACLLVWDSADDLVETISSIASRLIRAGCAFFCASGSGCERVHDIFDDEELGDGTEYDPESVILTTWHDDEPLRDTLFFFLNATSPIDRYEDTCNSSIAIVIGKVSSRLQIIRTALTQPTEFLAE